MKLILNFTLILFVALCCVQVYAEDEESFSCTANERFHKDCRSCKCGSTGTYASCSGFTCDPLNKSILMKAPENCEDGDSWSDGCNKCICISGKFACTRRGCYILLGKVPADISTTESP